MNFLKFWRGVFVLLLVIVTWQTLTPDPEETESGLAIARFLAELLFHDEKFGDKVAHFLAYASLGGSAAFAGLRVAGRQSLMVVLLAAYGGVLELIQGLGGVRVAEFADAISNSSGAIAGFPAALLIARAAARMRPA